MATTTPEAAGRLLGRLVLVPVGIAAAALAALACAAAGLAASGLDVGWSDAALHAWLLLAAAMLAGAVQGDPGAVVVALWLAAVGLLIAPIALVAITTEIFGLSSWTVHAFVMAGVFVALPSLFIADDAPGQARLGLAAAGLAAGTAYWLVAGRGAGRLTNSSR